jgi:hypothetical protein
MNAPASACATRSELGGKNGVASKHLTFSRPPTLRLEGDVLRLAPNQPREAGDSVWETEHVRWTSRFAKKRGQSLLPTLRATKRGAYLKIRDLMSILRVNRGKGRIKN